MNAKKYLENNKIPVFRSSNSTDNLKQENVFKNMINKIIGKKDGKMNMYVLTENELKKLLNKDEVPERYNVSLVSLCIDRDFVCSIVEANRYEYNLSDNEIESITDIIMEKGESIYNLDSIEKAIIDQIKK